MGMRRFIYSMAESSAAKVLKLVMGSARDLSILRIATNL
jgi:hypothetical protein